MRILLGACLLLALGGVAAGAGFYRVFVRDLPDFRTLEEYSPALTSVVVDRHGRPIGEFYEERRRLVALSEVPRHVILAFVASEDETFFEHDGIDYVSIVRAAWVNLTAGGVRQGASTITQQVAKSLLLSPERTYTRKLKEMILARRIEQRLSKDEILHLYLNQIYFGSGAYGIGEAARTYFGKVPAELTVSEAALLAGLPKAPSRYSPRTNPEASEQRRHYVLGQMLDKGFLERAAFDEAVVKPPPLGRPAERDDFKVAAYVAEEARRFLYQALGSEVVLRGGLRVETSVDLDLQREAVASLRAGLEALDRRRGYRGPLRQVAADAIAAEILEIGRENELHAGAGDLPPELPFETPLLGVVTAVEPEAKRALVSFAPGVHGEARLQEVKWARKPNPSRYPSPVRKIERIFSVGDVARFRRLPVETEEASEGEETPPELVRLALHQEPEVQGALLCLEIGTGELLALVGGYDFEDSEFNRAVQARRQPGSAFKPLIYAAAITKGYTPVSILYDRPVVMEDGSGFTWRPENYGREFLGPITMREALARSVNNATIHLFKDIGIDYVMDFARRVGIESPLDRNFSLALGSSPVSLLELTEAYSIFPAGGRRVRTHFIRRVEDREGQVLLQNVPLVWAEDGEVLPQVGTPWSDEPEENPSEPAGATDALDDDRVLDEADAFLATDLLRAVVMEPKGTGRKARRLRRALGGKTGTTNDQGDAWFVGFSPSLATGVWVGFDAKRVLGRGETGGRAALPIWIDYMERALADKPKRDFDVPEGIVFARIDRKTGLLADESSRDSFFQAFRLGTAPTEAASTAAAAAETRRQLRLDF